MENIASRQQFRQSPTVFDHPFINWAGQRGFRIIVIYEHIVESGLKKGYMTLKTKPDRLNGIHEAVKMPQKMTKIQTSKYQSCALKFRFLKNSCLKKYSKKYLIKLVVRPDDHAGIVNIDSDMTLRYRVLRMTDRPVRQCH